MATWQLEQLLRKTLGKPATPATVAGIGPGTWDSNELARQQDPADGLFTRKSLDRIYTEDDGNLTELVNRYFEGATILHGIGLDVSASYGIEASATIEVVSSKPDALQRIVNLAGDIREVNKQVSVLVTRQNVETFEVRELR
jgi:hypothetical protein